SVSDIWIWDLGAGNMQRITFDSASSAAEWLPDGRRLVYARASGPVVGLFTILADGSGKPESLLTRPNPIFESSPTPDGRALVFREMVAADGSNNRDIWITGLDSTQGARPLAATPFEERNPAVSPDGRGLAYTSTETGEYEVYVRGLAEGSGRTRVSTGNGGEPRWAHSGRELFFIGRDSVYAVTVTPGPEIRFSTPRGLLPTMSSGGLLTGWDVSPDDRRFVFARPPETTLGDPLRVVLHWFDHLRAARR
ncbi:MAG TPA: hypothetical protein VLL51_04430, partial [Gemmatimonadales bacterium]|nr:hypothetical protein [Gemmatimonadales bacterium]